MEVNQFSSARTQSLSVLFNVQCSYAENVLIKTIRLRGINNKIDQGLCNGKTQALFLKSTGEAFQVLLNKQLS